MEIDSELLQQQLALPQSMRQQHRLRRGHREAMPLLQLQEQCGPHHRCVAPLELSLELVVGTQQQSEEAEQMGQSATQLTQLNSHPGYSTVLDSMHVSAGLLDPCKGTNGCAACRRAVGRRGSKNSGLGRV